MASNREHGSFSQSPDQDFFNDLTQQPRHPLERNPSDGADGGEPKAKRIACVLCRKRKLKCDGNKPCCGTCKRLSHDCSYDEARRKSGPKRGYVKALEARLAQVETLLKTQDGNPNSSISQSEVDTGVLHGQGRGDDLEAIDETAGLNLGSDGLFKDINPKQPYIGQLGPGDLPDPFVPSRAPPNEIIGLGLEEPLPDYAVINELNQLFFEKVYPSMPLIHRPRYYATMNLGPQQRPPICLRYTMWCLAASLTDKYESLQEHFYARARKYAELDEMRGHGEHMITVSHVQTWVLLATYEFRMTYFPRAWMSTGRAARLALMMGLHRLDGKGLDVKQCLPPPRDVTDREERRRTFWMCFAADRSASIGTGWPMVIEESDIMTDLPCDEESFEKGIQHPTISLTEALDPDGASKISSLGGVAVLASLYGRNLLHLHRPSADDNEASLNGEFWKRHRAMDNILLNTALGLPDHLRLPVGLNDPNVVYLNMCIHTSTICLHQAAIYKADAHKMPSNVSSESKIRCITAAAEIASIMRMISHQDVSITHPFVSFCLYVAARVFVQYLKSRPQDHQVKASLHFLLTAMNALKKKHPLTESFMVQLDVDLQGAGLEDSRSLRTRLAKAYNGAHKDRFSYWQEVCSKSSKLHQEVNQEKQRTPTYGDGGLSKHTSPEDVSLDLSERHDPGNASYDMYNITRPQSDPYFSENTRTTYAVPSRLKTPSTNPTSVIVLEEAMDLTGDCNDSSSPESLQNTSSHTSNTSFTPPFVQHENRQPSWDNSVMNTEKRAVYLGDTQPMQTELYTENDFGYAELDYSNYSMNGMVTGINSGTYNPNINSNTGTTGLTPGGPGTFNGTTSTTGMTPGSDMLNMSDAEWKQMLDGGMLDMGWDGIATEKQGFHYASNPT